MQRRENRMKKKTEYLSPKVDILLIVEDILTGSGEFEETDEFNGFPEVDYNNP